MSTIIDGRGNLRREETNTIISMLENMKINPDKIETMTIEEYRNLKFTAEQEWNSSHNPKKVSIEALYAIEIKKKGKGPDKKIFYPGSKGPGPYYDPHCNHVHVWKKKNIIENFIGEQFQNVPYVQFGADKPGIYCSICHCKHSQFQFKWRQELDDCCEKSSVLENNNVLHAEEDFLPSDKIKTFPNCAPKPDHICKSTNRIVSKWGKFIYRVIYSLENEKTIYPVSSLKSLYMWPWKLTHYQKFKLNYPDYKSNIIFVKSDVQKFKDDYVIID